MSTQNGIVAAKEANNGSGIMAVASQHVVVMHDPRRNREASWGLNANDVRRRFLEPSSSEFRSLVEYADQEITSG
jgi:hypothetical protein